MSYADENGGAVYRMYDEAGVLIYIGSTGDLRVRLRTHLKGALPAGPDAAAIRTRYHRHEVEFHPTLAAARRAEAHAIAAEQPQLNRRGLRLEASPLDRAIRDAARAGGLSICEIAYRLDLDVRTFERLLLTQELLIGDLLAVAEMLGLLGSELAALVDKELAA